jgi:hypothetical protein
LDGFGAGKLGFGEGFFGFAEDDYGGATLAGGDGEAGGEADGLAGDVEGVGEDFRAHALGEENGIEGGAAGKADEELIVADAAEDVVAAQEALGTGGDLAEELVADFGAEAGVPMAEVVDVEDDEAEGGVHALDAVGFAEEEREHGFAVEGAGEAVVLLAVDDGVAELFELVELAAEAERDGEAEEELGGGNGGGDEVVDDAFFETILPFL